MKNTRSADFCADQIDVITNFAVITNVDIKRVHCFLSVLSHFNCKYSQGQIQCFQYIGGFFLSYFCLIERLIDLFLSNAL